ncbi:MAG: prephenate dehydrogenase/arogenate dehydrogenase family protein, partial [Candidatus Omnitrophica bacterium]|nr:prephenate dehydrogenase/arogenate dehydrogenase family protein [Candidatus Omnitrophota bacterium]
MRLFDTVAIVGTGLIGGSLALGMKKKRLCRRVIGIALHKTSLVQALRRRAVDCASRSLCDIRGADCVILATPPAAIQTLAPKIRKLVNPAAIIFDVASTKGRVVRDLDRLFNHYIGTHPLAGSEKRGVRYARADLFDGCLCILTPTARTDAKTRALVRRLWKTLGCSLMELSPRAHDAVLAQVSHLPHIVSFSLINSISPQALAIAPQSLREMTRNAGSDARLWTD